MTFRDRKSTDGLGGLITFAVAMDFFFFCLKMPNLSFQPLLLIVTFSDRLKGLVFFLVPRSYDSKCVFTSYLVIEGWSILLVLAILIEMNDESEVSLHQAQYERAGARDPKLVVLVSRVSVWPLYRKSVQIQILHLAKYHDGFRTFKDVHRFSKPEHFTDRLCNCLPQVWEAPCL